MLSCAQQDSPTRPTMRFATPLSIRPLIFAAAALLCAALAGCVEGPSEPPAAADIVHTPVDPIGLLPMGGYDQNIDHWLKPSAPDYDRPFLSAAQQQAQFAALWARYFGTGEQDPSPWNPAFVNRRVYGELGSDIADLQRRRLAAFDNRDKSASRIGYGQNYRPHTGAWIDAIRDNVDLDQFESQPHYDPAQRAIATDNAPLRELPTSDPSFYDHRLAGEGYPFDNLQISSLRPGTPVYILGTSRDGAWRYVQTPDVQGWVASTRVSLVDDSFVDTWRRAARAMLGGVIEAAVPVRDTGGVYRFTAPAGTLLPFAFVQTGAGTGEAGVASAGSAGSAGAGSVVLIPLRDVDGHARIGQASLGGTQMVPVPFAATPRHLAVLIKALIGRPYGWGNLNNDNDCSSELQSIFAVFGVWLPRHSSTQMQAGRMVDLSEQSPAARLDYLMQNGRPMRTLIYIGGHVMLYLGTFNDGHDPQHAVPVVYQDVWGLSPADDSRRAIIGGSVILPLLLRIPEDPALVSLAGKRIFQITILGDPVGSPSGAAGSGDEDNPAS